MVQNQQPAKCITTNETNFRSVLQTVINRKRVGTRFGVKPGLDYSRVCKPTKATKKRMWQSSMPANTSHNM